jgi:hypothetical protein
MQTDKFRLWFLIASIALLAALALVWFLDSRAVELVELTPELTGEIEYCLSCHSDLPEISPSHQIETFGCVICHGGERLALDADLAHSSMRGGANPSDLSVVEQSCGGSDCHSGSEADDRAHIQRVNTSIQATYAGAIASVRYTFGAQPDLDPRMGIFSIQDHSLPTSTGFLGLEAYVPSDETNPMLQKFGENCLTCHISAIPSEGVEYQRYTGCSACHTPLLTDSSESLNSAEGGEQVHTLTMAIPYSTCNTCHNRGNYDLGLMEFVERSDEPQTRIDDYYQPIAQFTQCEYTLDCIDCHTRGEAMGNGDIHMDMKSIEYVQCKTCHGTLTELPAIKTLTDPDDLAFRLAFLNPLVGLELGDTILITEQGEPLWNTRVLPDGSYELVGKVSGNIFSFKPVQGTDCEQGPFEQESHYCHECHAVEH